MNRVSDTIQEAKSAASAAVQSDSEVSRFIHKVKKNEECVSLHMG